MIDTDSALNDQADAATLIYDALAHQIVHGVTFNQALMSICDGDWRLFAFALRNWPGAPLMVAA